MASNQGIPPYFSGPAWPSARQPAPATQSFNDELLRLIPDGMAILDGRLSLRAANEAFCRMFHVARYDLLGEHPLMRTDVTFRGTAMALADALRGLPGDQIQFDCEHFTLLDAEGRPVGAYSIRATTWRPNAFEESYIVLWARQIVEVPVREEPLQAQPLPEQPLPEERPPAEPLQDQTAAVTEQRDGEQRIDDLLRALELVTDFDSLCEEILDMTLKITGGESGSLMLIGDNENHLRIAASRGISEAQSRSTKQRIGEGIAGKVAETGQSLLLVGRVGDDRFHGIGGRPGILSSICAPVRVEKRTIGVLNVNSNRDGQPFTETEHQKTCWLADRIGAVLNHSRRFQQIQRRSRELSLRAEIEAVAQSQSTLDARLGQIADRCQKILDVDTFMIYLMDSGKNQLKLQRSSGVSITHVPDVVVPLGTGLVGTAAEKNRAIVLQGGWDEEYGQKRFQLVSAGIPIPHKGELVGVIAFEKRCDAEHEIETVEVIQSVATSLGHLIRDTLSQDDSKRRLTALSALSELSVAMANSEDRIGLAKLVAYTAATILEQDVAMVRLRRGPAGGRSVTLEETELLAVHGRSFPGDDDPILKLETRLAEEVIRRGQACTSGDLPLEEIAPLLERVHLGRIYCIPIQVEGKILGFITVGSASAEDPSRSMDRDYAVDLGNRLADYASAVAHRFLASTSEA